MPLSTFLFDLDGTLIDSIDLILRSYRHVPQALGPTVKHYGFDNWIPHAMQLQAGLGSAFAYDQA